METLTSREQDVLKLLKDGYDNTEIADTIFVSRHTAKSHVGSIIRKLNAKNRTNAVYIAVINNLVPTN